MNIKVKLTSGNIIQVAVAKQTATIGRSQKCDVVVQEESISRTHCQIEITDGEFYITDLDSANGVYIDGNKIESNQKTRFSTFQEITVGNLECNVADDESEQSYSYNPAPQEQSIKLETVPTRPERKISRVALNKPLPKFESNKEKRKYFPIFFFILVIAGLVWSHFEKIQEGPSAKETVITNIPLDFKNVPDQFLALNEYKQKDALRRCAGFETACKELELSEKNSEGVLSDANSVFIFVRPQHYFEANSEFQKYQDKPEIADLVAINYLIKSSLFDEFLKKKFAQIHLVLKDETDLRIYRAYRFHTSAFSTLGIEKPRLLNDLFYVFQDQKPEAFWSKDAKTLIKKMDL